MESKIEIWGGIECTVNRVNDLFYDQIKWNRHDQRPTDLDLFAGLGLKALRFPALWERIAPVSLEDADWSWTDASLARMRELGIRPILGLVHHGSGPSHTSLIDPLFPEKLAKFARAVAERYPWVDAYTPVNEPLTTARFSGLYGHWYPHGRDEKTFARALLTQVHGVQLAMQAVRQVNPKAQLVQTEDLGKIYSTPLLEHQADFENTRRWLSLDLLVGRVTEKHGLYSYLLWAGISAEEIDAITAMPTPPDITGLNYYITGERFLDERLERYPENTHGGNGSQRYADVESVRVCTEPPAGIEGLLAEAWERYHRPLAVTEIHLGSTRDEQLRWLVEAGEAVNRLQRAGVDVRAITAWSLLGSYNWACLLTRDDQVYEPGVFDLRGSQPRPTALAHAIRAFAHGEPYAHPVLDVPGWWRRPERLLYEPVSCEPTQLEAPERGQLEKHTAANGQAASQEAASGPTPRLASRTALRSPSPRPLLITGATGTLGRAFHRLCKMRGLPHRLVTRRDLDITNPQDIERVLEEIQPWAVINTAGYVRVDQAEQEPEACMRANAAGPALLARASEDRSIQFMTFSSDLVFNGEQSTPYQESDLTAPLNVYGRSKEEAEARVLSVLPSALVIRTSAFFGPWDEYNFLILTLRSLVQGQPAAAAGDMFVSPTYVPDLVNTSLDLLIDGEQGLWHLANQGEVSWYEFARHAASAAGLDDRLVQDLPASEIYHRVRLPSYSVLGSERALLMPTLVDAIERFAAHRAPALQST